MLIKCLECELLVSDRAKSCPHCGYPLKKENKRYNKRRRLPNGFGQISEIKGQYLRSPFRAMVTVSKDPNGRPVTKIVGYYKSYNEAYAALVEYNRNPYDLDADLKLYELYDKWIEDYSKTLQSDSSLRTVKSAWAHSKQIYNIKVKDLRVRHIKAVIDEAPTPNLKSRIKSMFNIMLDYALEYELVDKNYARLFSLDGSVRDQAKQNYKGHISFTDDEIDTLWNALGKYKYVDLVLIQMYTGLRPQELGLIKRANCFIDDKYMIGGIKTDSGKNRVIPIHSKILELVQQKYNEGNEYLFEDNGKLTYDKYRSRFNKVIKELKLNPEHRAHDPRKQFITMAKKYNVDEYAIKRIVGHAILDITEKVYTDRDIEWLISEIEKIS